MSKWRVELQLPANNLSTSSQCKDFFTIGISLKLMAVARKSLTKHILREELHTCLLCEGRDKDGLKLSFDEEWKLRLVAL